MLLTPAAAESDVGTVRDAVRYETSVVLAVTIAAALAAVAVVGLAIARQANDEQDDPLVMSAIGVTPRHRASTSALPSIPVAVGAVAVAAATSIATSAVTPIGLARRAPRWTVVCGSTLRLSPSDSPLVAAIVVLAFVVPTIRLRRSARRTSGGRRSVRPRRWRAAHRRSRPASCWPFLVDDRGGRARHR